MKNIKFLIKIKKEGKIEAVEPNEEIKESYLKDSESYFISSKLTNEQIKIYRNKFINLLK